MENKEAMVCPCCNAVVTSSGRCLCQGNRPQDTSGMAYTRCPECNWLSPKGDSCHKCNGAALIKRTILDEADRITSGARRQQYGPPERNFERIASYWNVYFMNTGRSVLITPGDVSKMMRLMKEARLDETPDHYDSFVDIVGYALTEAETRSVKKPE